MKAFYTLVFVFICQFAVAQSHEISISMGYGVPTGDLDRRQLIVPPLIIGTHPKVGLLGMNYHFCPGQKRHFRLSLGAHYHKKWLRSSKSLVNNYDHLYIPLGFSFEFGKKLHFNFGGGFTSKILLKHHFQQGKKLNKKQRTFYYSLGTGYSFNETWSLRLEYRVNVDLNCFYVYELSKMNNAFEYDFYESVGIFQLSLAYNLSKK